jgi:hypothetical protein
MVHSLEVGKLIWCALGEQVQYKDMLQFGMADVMSLRSPHYRDIGFLVDVPKN